MMTSLNTSTMTATSSSASSTPRFELSQQCCRRLMEAAQQVQCQGCYSPITLGKSALLKPHPCLFCVQCLGSVTARGEEKYRREDQEIRHSMSKSSSEHSDIAAWERNGKHSSNHRRFSCNEVLLNASLKSTTGGLNFDQREVNSNSNSLANTTSSRKMPTSLDRKEFAEKLAELERRPTRCGLCLPWVAKKRLDAYCVQCRKYLCHTHTLSHTHNRYTKLHATVNLNLVPNDALL